MAATSPPLRRVQLASGESVPLRIDAPAAGVGGAPAVILAPGAGSSMDHPFLRILAEGLAAAGYVAATFDFPYRAAGRRVPDRAPVLVSCWQAVLEVVAQDPALAPPWIVVGGRSMGGRMASLLVADRPKDDLVRGLLLLGYPLHPARRPDQLRAAHLPRVAVPALFIQGTRDALATPMLLAPVVASMPRAELVHLADADHSYRVPRRAGRDEATVYEEVLGAVTRWLDALAGLPSTC